MKHKILLSLAACSLSFVLAASPSFAQAPRPKPTLVPGRMRACEARSTAISTKSSQLVDMATNMLEVFDSHVTRIKNFYTNVVLPSGKTLANYDTLVSNIDAKRQAVVDAWNKAKTNSEAFSCTNGNPKQLLSQFRLDMQATKTALKEYRMAIKNLIVAVKRVSPTPAPSASPVTE